MTQINPLAGSIVQSPMVQRQQAAEKDRQVRQARDVEKNSALHGDELEHQVESAQAITPIHDDGSHDPRARKRFPKRLKQDSKGDCADGEHLDLTA
jgi:hypothetical protein